MPDLDSRRAEIERLAAEIREKRQASGAARKGPDSRPIPPASHPWRHNRPPGKADAKPEAALPETRASSPEYPTTDRQREVFEAIKNHHREHGFMPTIRDLCLALGIRSPNGVMCHLRYLSKKGLITFGGNKSRGIRLVGRRCECCDGLGVVLSERSETR